MATAKAPSGRTIWHAVREELLLNLYALPFSTVAPTVYHVYLHPQDFEAIEGISGKLTDQIRQALTAEVERANRGMSSRVRLLLSRLLERDELPPIEVPSGGWDVNIRPDPDGELARGQLGIVCTLAMPAPIEYAGTPTTRIVRSVVGVAGRSATVTDVPLPAAIAASQQLPSEPSPPLPSNPQPLPAEAARPSVPLTPPAGGETEGRHSRDRARLTYQDERGPHQFVMRKDSVSIGRGGSAVWVDVQVAASSRVSREHVRIRVDAGGRWFVQDVSLWGTTVDGVAIPPAVKGPEGVAHPGAEHPLQPHARIGLADAIVLEFEALGPR